MTIAIFSDVHGNSIALNAVLADIATQRVDGYWVLGDLVALGPHPATAARTLAALPNARFVRGNTDRYTLANDRPGGAAGQESARQDPEKLEGYIGFVSSFPWARGAVSESGHYGWLQAIPLEVRVELPDGSRVLLIHAAPGTDDGRGIHPDITDDELATVLDDVDAELVIVGHTHIPLDREAGGVKVHNPGSVSLPKTDDHRAMWTLLTTDATGYALERRYVEYDIERVRSAFDAVHHPFAAGLKAMFPVS